MASSPAIARHQDRMPPLADSAMDEVQRAAAAELIAGPRKGVKGPFIPLLRSPELMARLQKVGEYLRFDSSLRACRSSQHW
jgi:4-carboxymuconolactone decarboxylase